MRQYLSTFCALIATACAQVSDESMDWSFTLGSGGNLQDVIYDGERYFALNLSGPSLVSRDGSAWTRTSITLDSRKVVFGNGVYLRTGPQGRYLSSDLQEWEFVPLGEIGALRELAFGKERFVGTTRSNELFYSDNGRDWTLANYPSGQSIGTVIGSDIGFVMANGLNVLTSEDGITWTVPTIPGRAAFPSILSGDWDGEKLVLAGTNQVVTTSDLTTWEVIETQGIAPIKLAAASGVYAAVTNEGGDTVRISTDGGQTWAEIELNPGVESSRLEDITYGSGGFIAVNGRGRIYRSSDGLTWETTLSEGPGAPSSRFATITYFSDTFITVANGDVISSTNGEQWQPIRSFSTGGALAIARGNGQWVTVGTLGAIYSGTTIAGLAERRSDVDKPLAEQILFNAVAFGNDRWVAVGSQGAGVMSRDGIDWMDVTLPNNLTYQYLDYGNDRFLAIDSGGQTAIRSVDGVNWTSFDLTSVTYEGNPRGIFQVKDLKFIEGRFVLSAFAGIFSSIDGVNWNIDARFPRAIQDVVRDPVNGDYLAAGGSLIEGTYYTATALGGPWTERKIPRGGYFRRAAAGGGTFLLISETRQTFTACPRYPLDLTMTRLGIDRLRFDWIAQPRGERELWSSTDLRRDWSQIEGLQVVANGGDRSAELVIERGSPSSKRFFQLRKP